LRLRIAEDGDCQFLFDLRNHPIVREASFSTDEISFDQHEVWFKKTLKDPDTVIYVGLDDSNERIGMVRFKKNGEQATISMAVTPSIHGKGHGTAIIRDSCNMYMHQESNVDEIIAEIKKSNITSVKVFGKAGFVETKSDSEKSEMILFRPLEGYTIGLKIFTSNQESFGKLRELHEKQIIDFVELYIVPGVIDTDSLDHLKGVPVIFHAPNFNHGFNLRDKDQVFEESLKTLKVISEYLDEKRVIFHPGLQAGEDDIEHILTTLRSLEGDYDIILENMPKKPLKGDRDIIASHFGEFKDIVNKTGFKICIDIGHTICSANHYREEALHYIQSFISLDPFMFHIGDGEYSSVSDVHRPLNEGDFPLADIVSMIPPKSRITLETPKSDFILLSEDLVNLQRLRKLIRENQ
jgi:deoxyribonuclease-4